MTRRIVTAMAVVAALWCPAAAFGQFYGDVDTRRGGDGTIVVANRAQRDVDSARVILRKSGSASIWLYGDSGWSFTGRWRENGRNGATIRLETAFGARGYGEGTIRLDRGVVQSVSISGSSRGERFRATFESGRGYDRDDRRDYRRDRDGDYYPPYGRDDRNDRGWPGNRDDRDRVDLSPRGDGYMTVNGARRDDFRSARVQVNTGGTLRITFYGHERRAVAGNYWRSGNTLSFTVTGGLGNDDTSGSGKVYLSGNRVDRIELQGYLHGDRYSIRFNAD